MSTDGGNTTTTNKDNWRLNVSQSDRNTEVREIAKVLAALEKNASSSSKMMLAMRFEDSLFKGATSLEEYRKKIKKRLRKLQKNYKQVDATANGGRSGYKNNVELIKNLRTKYGDNLLFIKKYANAAINELRAKKEIDKANTLQKHTDLAEKWASELGLLPKTKPNYKMSEEYTQKVQQHLEMRVENIRSHVVKLAHPDRFLQETLEKAENELRTNPARYLADITKKRFEQLNKSFDPVTLLKESLEKAQTTVPPATRNNRTDLLSKGALLHLEKMRAASTAVVAYLAVPDKDTVATNTTNTMAKTYKVAMEGIKFVGDVMKERRKSFKEPELALQDAWNKIGKLVPPQIPEVPPQEVEIEGADKNTTPAPKRRKLSHNNNQRRPVLRSSVLLTAGRKTPPHLIPELKRKNANLVRPLPKGQGSHLILHFGKAFVITIYFVPLLVTIRAIDGTAGSGITNSSTSETAIGTATWTPLHHGLITTNFNEDDNSNDTKSNHGGDGSSGSNYKEKEFKLWGVSGTYETIGNVIQERLRDASSHATQILRHIFATHGTTTKENASDFEIEILEASALLKFLDIARKAYIPDWQDAEL